MAAREAYSRKESVGPCLGPADESSSARSSRALRGTAVEGRRTCADGPLSSLLEPAPVALPFQTDDAAEAGRLEVAGRDEDLLALEPLDERPPRLARQLRVHVRARDPVGLLELHRRVRGVAPDEFPLAAGGDQDAHGARR